MSKKLDPETSELVQDIKALTDPSSRETAKLTARLLVVEILQYLEVISEDEVVPLNLRELPGEIKKVLPKEVTGALKAMLSLANGSNITDEQLNADCTALIEWLSK